MNMQDQAAIVTGAAMGIGRATARKLAELGCRVALVSMGPDPYSRLKPGDEGTVFHVDDSGTVHVNWDCGSTLGMVYGVDVIRKL